MDDQLDQTATLVKEVEYFKREILKGSSRQQKYFEELIMLYKTKDM